MLSDAGHPCLQVRGRVRERAGVHRGPDGLEVLDHPGHPGSSMAGQAIEQVAQRSWGVGGQPSEEANAAEPQDLDGVWPVGALPRGRCSGPFLEPFGLKHSSPVALEERGLKLGR
eukprot:3715062-Lingulodinium_polyedra.AAC.1